MIKNIVFDIGGVLLDTSNEVLVKVLNKTEKEVRKLSKIVYGNQKWKQCLLGNVIQEEYRKELEKNFPNYKKDFEILLAPAYQDQVLPVKKEMLEVMYELKKRKYKIFFLSNLTEATYKYVKNHLNVWQDFDGGIFSWKEQLVKPQGEIYELLLKRYQLNKEETIFFDDQLKNVEAGNRVGIKSVLVRSVEDIKREILE